MPIYGPVDKEIPSQENADLSLYAKKSNVLYKSGGSMGGVIDMNQNRIINLPEVSRPERTDVATIGYVSNYVSHLNNVKLEKAGDTMTGELNMDNNKITHIGTPVEETDATNKQYVDAKVGQAIEHERLVSVYGLGRYIVIPDASGTKTYFSVRQKRNINLANGLLVEIKNNIADSNENIFNNNPQDITIRSDLTPLPNANKPLGILQLNSGLFIEFRSLHYLSKPWTFIFSSKPKQSSPQDTNGSVIAFYNETDRTFKYITTFWTSESFKYVITNGDDNRNTSVFSVNTTQFNHIVFEYVENKLTVWLNGASRKTHNIYLGNMSEIRIGVKQLGIASLYNRKLNKTEIVEHFIENHVENWTNDEVLI